MKVLERTQFGNAVLRKKARWLSEKQIASPEIQQLIADMRHTLVSEKLGVGLAAPQVGKSHALSVIALRPTAHRPKITPLDLVIINPTITETYGEKVLKWEGCISGGSNGTADLFAKVPRYRRVRVEYTDEHGNAHHRWFRGLMAQIMQHEIDHLHGILFVDHVTNTKTYMTYSEYMKHVANKKTARG